MLEDSSFEDIAIGGKEGIEGLLVFLNECEDKVIEITRKSDPPYSIEDGGVLLDINREYMKIYMDNTYGIFPGNYLESFPDKFIPLEFKLNLDDENK